MRKETISAAGARRARDWLKIRRCDCDRPDCVVTDALPAAAPVRDSRITEQRNPRSAAIDLADPQGIVDLMLADDRTVPDAVATARVEIARAIAQAEHTFRRGGRLFYIGAGTSGRLGVLDASECPPTFGSDPRMVQGIIAGGDHALRNAVEGAEDRASDGAAAIDAAELGEADFLVGIAASGTTPYVRDALIRAKARGAATAIVACSPPPAATLAHVDIPIVTITGPEVLTGSTRLKAGTATKLVLNMISTGAMIRIGKSFGNLMVDLRATNVKLIDRSERILMEVGHLDRPAAAQLLAAAGGSVKTALVMQLLGVDREAAERQLEQEGGVIRRAVPAAVPPPVASA
jgi:N-acetylmuramic acid 6-phosphate etherase